MGTKKERIYGKGGATEVWGAIAPNCPAPMDTPLHWVIHLNKLQKFKRAFFH